MSLLKPDKSKQKNVGNKNAAKTKRQSRTQLRRCDTDSNLSTSDYDRLQREEFETHRKNPPK